MEFPAIDPSSIHLYRPPFDSRKGQNGRLLVIGGSKLFHSSIFWSADVASRIVDLVHFTSPANENNELVRKKLKDGFWSGIVVEWRDVEHYIEEDDCVLIGPGMVRGNELWVMSSEVGVSSEGKSNNSSSPSQLSPQPITQNTQQSLKEAGKRDDTAFITNVLLRKYPKKRWVVDGGALQEVDPRLINEHMIITPNQKEFLGLLTKTNSSSQPNSQLITHNTLLCQMLSKKLHNCTIVLKGPTDIICQDSRCVLNKTGNEGMTKGGTGDVLAGLVAALYCKNDSWTSATAGAYVNGLAGDRLKKRVGVYYNAQDLLNEIPPILRSLFQSQ